MENNFFTLKWLKIGHGHSSWKCKAWADLARTAQFWENTEAKNKQTKNPLSPSIISWGYLALYEWLCPRIHNIEFWTQLGMFHQQRLSSYMSMIQTWRSSVKLCPREKGHSTLKMFTTSGNVSIFSLSQPYICNDGLRIHTHHQSWKAVWDWTCSNG